MQNKQRKNRSNNQYIIRQNEVPTIYNTFISECGDCSLNNQCKFFKHKYQDITNKANQILENKKKQIYNNGAWNQIDKANELDKLVRRKNESIKKCLRQLPNKCIFEQKAIQLFYESLEDKYKVQDNPQIRLLIDELVKLKLYDIKIMLHNNKFGLFTEGEKGIQMAAGLSYSITISDKITNIIEKIDKMFYQYDDSATKVNVNIINIKDIFGQVEARDLERKKIQ